MDCSFGNSVKCVLSVTPKILAQSTKVWKILFLLKICPSETSAGHLECIPDEPGVFLQSKYSSEGPRKYIKLYLLPKNFFSKSFTGHADFSFDTPVETFRRKSGISSFKISKQSQNFAFFRKKNVLSQSVSLDTWDAVSTNLPKLFRQETGTFFFLAQKAKNFGLWQNVLLEVFLCTRRMRSWFALYFFLKCLWTGRFKFDTTSG